MHVIHITLPQDYSPSELATWLKQNSVESFTDEIKRYFTPEQISEFEHESSSNGRSKNRLDDLLKEVTAAIKKGWKGEDALVVEIPASIGTDLLDKTRRQNDDFIEKGYEIEETEVYGVVNEADETMEFVTIEGELVKERTRNLTPKEKIKWLGMRAVSMRDQGLDKAVNE